MEEKILQFLQDKGIITTGELVEIFGKDRTTIYRWLKKLETAGKIQQTKKGTYVLIVSNESYFNTPTWERKKAIYRPEFLRSYIPNKTYFFSEKNLKKLENSVRDLPLATDFYKNNKRFIEKSLIDLSFASSYLEGNTYSYLDTEVLLKYHEINKNKTEEETQMVINHKKAIEYMIYYKKDLTYNKSTFFEIHSLLGDRLLLKSDLGTIRSKIVEIGGSTYQPLETSFQLEDEFIVFLEKVNQIINPFEKSLFIMIFIPYFQLFLDINKRTSRVMCNLPLVQHNLPLLSMIQLEKKKYILAILSVYELNDVHLLQEIRTENYLLNIEGYKRYFV